MSHFLSECSPGCPFLSLSYTKLRLSACPPRLIEEYSGRDTYTQKARGGMEYGQRIHSLFRNDTVVLGLFPHARKIEFERELRIPHRSGVILHGFIDCIVKDDWGTHVLELKTGYLREYSRGQLAWYMGLLLLEDRNLDPLSLVGHFIEYGATHGFTINPIEVAPLPDIDTIVTRYIRRMELDGCEYLHGSIAS